MILAYFILTVHPRLTNLLHLVAVGNVLETVLVAVFFETKCEAVAIEEENVPFAHDGSFLF